MVGAAEHRRSGVTASGRNCYPAAWPLAVESILSNKLRDFFLLKIVEDGGSSVFENYEYRVWN